MNYYDIANLLKSGIISSLNNETIDYLKHIQQLCIPSKDDTNTDKIFKEYIKSGKLTALGNKYRYSIKPQVSDILFYRQCSNTELTILAKIMYLNTNKNLEFVKWQVDILIKNGYIDIYEEHIKFKKHKYPDDEQLQKLQYSKEFYENK